MGPPEPNTFEAVLSELSQRDQDEVLAAFAAVEHCPDPVPEAALRGLRDATLRRYVQRMLHRIGRTLVTVDQYSWTSGFRDDAVAELTGTGWNPLTRAERAVLVGILIHAVAIPRSEGTLEGDSWGVGRPTPMEELTRYSRIPRGDVHAALRRLRAAGLVRSLPGRDGVGPSYVPGSQFHRLTEPARRRLQEELILAAGPDTPLAGAIRARRGGTRGSAEVQ